MSSCAFQKLVSFVPPRLLNNSLGWHIEYYVLDPISESFIRKRFRLNTLRKHCESKKEFMLRANQLLQDLTEKLSGGWTPCGEESSNRYYVPLFDAMQKFLDQKKRELRPDSMRTYNGIIKILKEWLVSSPLCIEFGRVRAIEFMDYCYTGRKVSSTTYNTYLKLSRVIFGWLQDNLYIKSNPFVEIKKKRADEKFRTVIPEEDRKRIAKYFEQQNMGYLFVCDMVFYSLIRPTELTRLRVRDIDKVNGCIYLPDSTTKCHQGRFTPIDPVFFDRLCAFIEGHDGAEYVFGRSFSPGVNGLKKKQYLVMWERMRKDLKMPDEYQLYSLRDSGIRAKLDSGMDPAVVMRAAGHHNLAETTKYAIKANKDELAMIIANSPTLI